MASPPSAVRGHSSCRRSRYSSTPLPSGSRRYRASETPWSEAPRRTEITQEPLQGLREVAPLRIEDGKVEEACRLGLGGTRIAAHPGVEADVVVVAARGEEHRVVAVPLHHLEAENIPVEAKGPLDVRHFQVNVAEELSQGSLPAWFARSSPFLLPSPRSHSP